jgi:hypothetical protein
MPRSPDNKWDYTVISSTHARITAYYANEATVVVPATLGGYPVRELSEWYVFGGHESRGNNITTIDLRAITDTLTLLTAKVFGNLPNLSSVIWPKTVVNSAGASDSIFTATPKLLVFDIPENFTIEGWNFIRLVHAGGSSVTVNFKNSAPPTEVDPGPYYSWKDLFKSIPNSTPVTINAPSNWTGGNTVGITDGNGALMRTITINKTLAAYSAGGGGAVACFAPGTRVLTAAGYKAVEALSAGDKIVSADGRALPFTLFKGAVITTEKSAPFLIKKNAFGAVPTADVRLSPIHTFQTRKGVWQTPRVAAKTNDKVVQESVGEEVTYYHIELPNYFTDNIISEGLVVESFGARQAKGVNVYTYSNRLGGMTRSVPSSLKKHL